MDVFHDWQRHGLFLDHFSEEERTTYGRWTIGTYVPPDHPGYTKRLFVKSPWIARPPKYLPGRYPFKNRADTGEWEYVRVLRGRLDLLIRDDGGKIHRFPLEAGEDVDIPPEPFRAWELPEGRILFAMGTMVLRRPPQAPVRPGGGEGYEFRLWDARTPERLAGPLALHNWSIQYVDVLGGSLTCGAAALPGRRFTLEYGCHAFARPGAVTAWAPADAECFGTVLYL